MKQKDFFKIERQHSCAFFFALIFSIINCVGYEFQNKLALSKNDVVIIFVNSGLLCLFMIKFYLWIRNKSISEAKKRTGDLQFGINDRRYFLICLLVTVISYTIVFLAYFPGFNNYDAYSQIKQGVLKGYNAWHPIAHTLWLKFFLYGIGGVLNSDTIGWAIGNYVQMALLSMSISYMHLLFYRMRVNRAVRRGLVLYLAVNPLVSIMAISSTKDTLFSGFFLLVSVCLAYWSVTPVIYQKKRMAILYIVSIVGVILFRNNGIYGIMLVLLVGGLIMIKSGNRSFVKLTLLAIIIGVFSNFALQVVTRAEKVNYNEALSLPYQQIAYVYHVNRNEISEDKRVEIEYFIPEVENYSAHFADKVKNSGTALNSQESFYRFAKLYISLGVHYPISYIEAFIQQNLGYLYIADIQSANIHLGADEDRFGGLLETELREGHEPVQLIKRSFFPSLERLYEDLFTLNKYQRILPLFLMCSLGIGFWAILLISVLCVDFKCNKLIVIATNLFGFIITILLGPMAAVRYALPYMLTIPVFYFSFVCNLSGIYRKTKEKLFIQENG